MIKLWSITGEMKNEIGQLIRFYVSRNMRPDAMKGKGVMGKRLNELLSESHEIAPENLISFDLLGVRKRDGTPDVPETYEAWIERQKHEKQDKISEIMGAAFAGHATARV